MLVVPVVQHDDEHVDVTVGRDLVEEIAGDGFQRALEPGPGDRLPRPRDGTRKGRRRSPSGETDETAGRGAGSVSTKTPALTSAAEHALQGRAMGASRRRGGPPPSADRSRAGRQRRAGDDVDRPAKDEAENPGLCRQTPLEVKMTTRGRQPPGPLTGFKSPQDPAGPCRAVAVGPLPFSRDPSATVGAPGLFLLSAAGARTFTLKSPRPGEVSELA